MAAVPAFGLPGIPFPGSAPLPPFQTFEGPSPFGSALALRALQPNLSPVLCSRWSSAPQCLLPPLPAAAGVISSSCVAHDLGIMYSYSKFLQGMVVLVTSSFGVPP